MVVGGRGFRGAAVAGDPTLPTAQFAVRGDCLVAYKLLRVLAGQLALPFRCKPFGSMASIGLRALAAGSHPIMTTTMTISAPVGQPRLFTFVGGNDGAWSVLSARTVVGDALQPASRVSVLAGAAIPQRADTAWALGGITSNERYVERHEKASLVKTQASLGRTEATRGALIPIRKTAAWWALTQDERRAIFEAQSHHIAVGLRYLPAVARRLHHCRDLGPTEPFDFLTWFDYAPSDESAFDDLLAAMRSSAEWAYVDREVDIRLVRDRA